MKDKTLISLSFMLFILSNYVFSSTDKTERDTVVSLAEYTIADNQIFDLLDSAINHEFKYFRKNSSFAIGIMKENKRNEFSIGFLNDEDVKHFKSEYCGYIMYRNNLFFIKKSKNFQGNRLFRKTKSTRLFDFKVMDSGLIWSEAEETGWFYFYEKKRFIFNYIFDTRLKKTSIRICK